MPVLTMTADGTCHTPGATPPRWERMELLIDRDAPLLELSPVGTTPPAGRSPLVTAIGIVARVPCVILTDEAAAGGLQFDHQTVSKAVRATSIASANRLPLIYLLESQATLAALTADPQGAGPATAATLAAPSPLAATPAPAATIAAVFGQSGGCETGPGTSPGHRVLASGSIELVAADDQDAVRIVRSVVSGLASPAPHPLAVPDPPHASADLESCYEPYQLLARVLDGSRFDEFKPGTGRPVHTGWGAVHGYPVAVLADGEGPWDVEVVRKVKQFVGLAALSGTPLLRFHDRDRSGTCLINREKSLQYSASITIVLRGSDPRVEDPVDDPVDDPVKDRRWPRSDPGFRFHWPAQTEAEPAEPCPADDGTIDPRDTRTVVGLCLAVMAYAGSGPAAKNSEQTGNPRS